MESIGQAATAVNSPYTSPSLDPRVNYQAIAQSRPVLAAAAEIVNLNESAFEKPRIKLVDQTSLIHLSIVGSSANQAYQKARALNTALKNQLEHLRFDETRRRSEAVRSLLQSFQDKLDQVQSQMLDYQIKSDLTSLEQLQEMTITTEQLRKEKVIVQAQYNQVRGKVQRLETNLTLTSKLASDVLLLQADPVFQKHLLNYVNAQSEFEKNSHKWASRHPNVLKFQWQADQAHEALLRRGKNVLGYELENHRKLLSILISSDANKRGFLLQALVSADADMQGASDQLQSIQKSLDNLDARLKQGSVAAAELVDLQRKHQVATAVFTSMQAKLDLGQSDPFASYPLIQVLSEPQLPQGPDTLKSTLALLGASVGSVFVIIGLLLLWIRQSLFQKILKNV